MPADWTTPAAVAGTYYSVLDLKCNPSISANAMVIGISGASTVDPAQAILFHWQDDTNQHRTKQVEGPLADGTVVCEIINGKSGKCLDKLEDVPDGDGNAVYRYSCTGASNRFWYQVSANSIGRCRSR